MQVLTATVVPVTYRQPQREGRFTELDIQQVYVQAWLDNDVAKARRMEEQWPLKLETLTGLRTWYQWLLDSREYQALEVVFDCYLSEILKTPISGIVVGSYSYLWLQYLGYLIYASKNTELLSLLQRRAFNDANHRYWSITVSQTLALIGQRGW
jgi:hypothetical protein